MKKLSLLVLMILLVGATPEEEALYTADITQRANKATATLDIADAAKAEKVRDLIVAQYRGLRDLHDARDAKLKTIPDNDKDEAAKVKDASAAEVKKLHDEFLAKLSAAELSAGQIEKVKDALTYNKVHVDFNAFCDMLPQLTEPQKAYILEQLKEAREVAMDGGNSAEKQAIFGKYRGRINNYLSKQGYDLKQASKDWADRRAARQAKATQPATAN